MRFARSTQRYATPQNTSSITETTPGNENNCRVADCCEFFGSNAIEKASAQTNSSPAAALSGDTLSVTTLDGTKYENVTLSRIEPDGLVLMTDSGITKVPFEKLSPELQKSYGYDPEKAAAFQAKQKEMKAKAAQNFQVAQAKVAEQQKAQQASQASEAENQRKMLSAKRIKGRVVQATKEGLLVDCDAEVAVASSSASVGGGGGVYSPPDPNGKGRPNEAYGLFFVVNHPQQSSIADDAGIDVDAYEDGLYKYVTVTGAEKRIKKYVVVRAFK